MQALAVASGPARHVLRRPCLFIDVQHGLCNRLRAMASAASIAAATGRELVVIWRADHHCEARIGDVLHYAGAVIETDVADDLRATSGFYYNYMEVEPDSCFEAPILAGIDAGWCGDVYVRSAYPLKGPHADFGAEQAFLRRLQPAQAVRDLLVDLPRPFDVCAHIRMAGGAAYEHLPYESLENWPEHRHRELAEHRGKSHRDHFVQRLDALVAQGQAERIFLAADLPETYAALADRYGARLSWLRRDLYDRSPRQLQYALADLLLLSAGKRFLGSPWSSFTDVAQRLANPARPFEISGRDF
jgi:hypothetical protein